MKIPASDYIIATNKTEIDRYHNVAEEIGKLVHL